VSNYQQKNEKVYDLRENLKQRRQRARALRAIYALVDPNGWDARRQRARQQTTAHS
jgi:hypothetical protein